MFGVKSFLHDSACDWDVKSVIIWVVMLLRGQQKLFREHIAVFLYRKDLRLSMEMVYACLVDTA